MSQSRITLPLQRGTLAIDRTQFSAALLSGRNVLAVGRIKTPCSDCRDFRTVMVRSFDGRLVPAHCPACLTIPRQNGR
jgi:hypothetical protein